MYIYTYQELQNYMVIDTGTVSISDTDLITFRAWCSAVYGPLVPERMTYL